MLNSLLLQEPQIEHPEHQDNYDVHDQPHPEPVPQEQDVHAHHDGYQHEHVKRDGSPFSHPSLLLRAALLVNLTGLQLIHPGRDQHHDQPHRPR